MINTLHEIYRFDYRLFLIRSAVVIALAFSALVTMRGIIL